MWETFFLGTARRTESQISAIRPGMVSESAAGLRIVWGRKAAEVCQNRDQRPAAEARNGDGDETRSRGSMLTMCAAGESTTDKS